MTSAAACVRMLCVRENRGPEGDTMLTVRCTLIRFAVAAATVLFLAGCSDEPEGLASATPADTVVVMDFYARPLPEIPLPNDIATRYDETSPTLRRINASFVAPTQMESLTRERLGELDGWGLMQPITVPFSGPLDPTSIIDAHHGDNFATGDDVIYLVDVDPDSPDYGEIQHMDLGDGSYPVVLERRDKYQPNDSRGDSLSLLFEEINEDVNGNGVLDGGEDLNGNGVLDPGEDLDNDGILDGPEDTDADGILDRANYLPGANPDPGDLAGRADAIMTFYEMSTNTLIARPMTPLREGTTYAVVVTRRLLDADGEPVGSPYADINHAAQSEALQPLRGIFADNADAFGGLTLADVAFAYSFTTQTVTPPMMAVREGLRGRGVQAGLAEQFPAEIAEIFPLVSRRNHPRVQNEFILQTEFIADVLPQLIPLFGADLDPQAVDLLIDSHKYIDYHVFGRIESPQLFERWDEAGGLLPWNDQVWPHDLERTPATARSEDVFFWLAVPRKEVSVRGQGEPAPMVYYSHGYTSNHIDALVFAGFMAQHGVAAIAIDHPSHGLVLDGGDAEALLPLAEILGLGPLMEAVTNGRAYDQNNDGKADSGEDFFTAYVFHTRDNVRQSVMDLMNVARIVDTFDGVNRMNFDLDGDGENELAGDFDGDGFIDVGGDAHRCGFGVSLGGMIISVFASLEPTLSCVAPVLPGGGVSDIAIRSLQGGVPQAYMLRSMGPLYLGFPHGEQGIRLATYFTEGNSERNREIAISDLAMPGDTLLIENLDNGERGCGFITEDRTVRAAAASDAGDRHILTIYRGPALVPGDEHCAIREGAMVREVIDTFGHGYPAPAPQADPHEAPDGYHVLFNGQFHLHGDPLLALADGLGMQRGDPSLRRLINISQAVMDETDPAVFARHMIQEPLVYEATGETTEVNVLGASMAGDMGVPTSAGATLARAMGLLPYLEVDPRYGKSANQVLIDTFTMEAVHSIGRHHYDPDGFQAERYQNGVHMDVENLSLGTDIWGDAIPRLDPPLRLNSTRDDGGRSQFIFPLPRPEGEHGFPLPGELRGRLRDDCRANCPDGDDCGCGTLQTFEPAVYLFNHIFHFVGTAGFSLKHEMCMSSNDCRCDPAIDGENCLGWPEVPELRPLNSFYRSDD